MPPQALSLAFFVLQEAIKAEPAIATAIQNLFTKGVPTEKDWADLHVEVGAWQYKTFVPASDIPPDV